MEIVNLIFCSYQMGFGRVQALLPHCAGLKRPTQPFNNRSGAVIFGRSQKSRWCWPSKGEPFERKQSESEGEEESEFVDSALGESNSLTSEPDSRNLDASPSDESSNNAMMSGGVLNNEEIENRRPAPQNAVGPSIVLDEASTSVSEMPKKRQMISRGVKRTLEKFTPQISNKKRMTSFEAGEAVRDAQDRTPSMQQDPPQLPSRDSS